MPLIYVIILSWNEAPALRRCLASVKAATYPNLQILVVDNASTELSIAEMVAAFPTARFILNEANLGFGAGCNVGIKIALRERADFIFLLNQDCIIAPTLFESLIAAAETQPEAGIFAPKTYFLEPTPSGKPRLLYGGAWRGRWPLHQHIPGIEQADDGSRNTPGPVDFAWGHGILVRRAVWQTVGLFDERFFMYYEDLDLCRRARAEGFALWYTPQSEMWHDLSDGARAAQPSASRMAYKAVSKRKFYHKYYGFVGGCLLNALDTLDEARQMWGRDHRLAAKMALQQWLLDLWPLTRPAKVSQ